MQVQNQFTFLESSKNRSAEGDELKVDGGQFFTEYLGVLHDDLLGQFKLILFEIVPSIDLRVCLLIRWRVLYVFEADTICS